MIRNSVVGANSFGRPASLIEACFANQLLGNIVLFEPIQK